MTALVAASGVRIPLAVDRWRREVDEVERELLASLPGPALDVGCGPGRVAAALAASGCPALGIDPAPSAVKEAIGRGALALRRSVFDPLPGEGRWGAAVLLDGNIGIGGDPLRLLHRLHALLRPDGVVLVEVDAPGSATERLAVRLEARRGRRSPSPWFPWALVAADAFPSLAADAGFADTDVWAAGGRWFGRGRRR